MASYPFTVVAVDLAGLQADAIAAGLPVASVNGGAVGSADVSVITSRNLMPAELTQLTALCAAHVGTLSRAKQLRAAADALLTSDPDAVAKAVRSGALAGEDEINALRSWLTSFVAQTALAVSLADFKARVATLPALPQRTKQQLLNAATAHLDAGDVD